jgi:hypothetical protein
MAGVAWRAVRPDSADKSGSCVVLRHATVGFATVDGTEVKSFMVKKNIPRNATCVQSLIAILSARTFFIEQTEGERPGLKSIASGASSPMNRLSGMYVISLSTTLIATVGAG